MDKPIFVVENFANKVIFVIVFFKINYILKYLSFNILYKVAYFIGNMFIYFNPKTTKAISKFQNSCYDEVFVKQYFNNLFYNIVLLCTYPYYSEQKSKKLINNKNLEYFLEQNKDTRFNIGGIHFFNFLTITTISDIFFKQNKRIFASFVLGDNKILKNFLNHIRKRFHYNYHYTFNLANDKNGSNKLKELYENTNCNFFLFCDVSFKRKENNINIMINNANLNFNNGYSTITKKFSDCKNLIIYLTLNRDYTFEHNYLIIDSIDSFYDNKFKDILKENKELWQLWFFNPIFE